MSVLETDYLFQTLVAGDSEQYFGILYTRANESEMTQNSQSNNNPIMGMKEY